MVGDHAVVVAAKEQKEREIDHNYYGRESATTTVRAGIIMPISKNTKRLSVLNYAFMKPSLI
jgi:hypothetical protein